MKPSDSSDHAAPRSPASPGLDKSLFDWPRDAGMTEHVVRAMQHEVGRRRRHRIQALAATAAVAVGAGLLWTWPVAPAEDSGNRGSVAAAPMTAAPKRQLLPDGSVIFLRDQAEVAVEFTDALRRVNLLHGEASFTVAKNAAKPFVVQAGAVRVQAVGTEFFVKRGDANVDVLVTEGCVAVAHASATEVPLALPAAGGAAPLSQTEATLVNAGRRVSVPFEPRATWEVLPVSPAEFHQRSAWRAPNLTFARTPLREVVASMNRYGALRLVLEDRSLEDVKLSGTIRGDNFDALLELLATDYGIKAERRGEFAIVLIGGARSSSGRATPSTR